MVQSQQHDIHQDAVTQVPALNGYTNLVRGFQTRPPLTHEAVVSQLQSAWDHLRDKIPLLGHHVVFVQDEEAAAGASSAARHVRSAPWPASSPPNNVVGVDKTAELPSLASLVASRETLDESRHLFPVPGLPAAHGLELVPVMTVRAVFIEGGVLLALSAHHNIIDGSGLMQIWDHLATVMNGDALSELSICEANADRALVLPLLSAGQEMKDYSHLMRPDPWPLPPPPKTEWRIFMLPRAALSAIKAQASPATAGGQHRVSSDDALSVFCWQRLSAVRLRLGRVTAEETSKFGRAVSGRGAMGLGTTYLGHMMLHSATHLPIRQLVDSSLADLAAIVRRDLEDARTEWSVRSYATFLAQTPDKTTVLYGGLTNPRKDLGGTSVLPWATKPLFHMGALGPSKLFRKPSGAQIPACLYFLPSDDAKGSIQLLLCLTREELDGLAGDDQWGRYFEANRRLATPKL